MINSIGCRAHDYGKKRIDALVKEISEDGFESIQLAFKKALIESDETSDFLTPDFVKSIKLHLDQKNLKVAVLGAYLNYCGSDDQRRMANIQSLIKHLKIAKVLGCRMVGTETGSLNDDYTDHVDNHGDFAYQRLKETVIDVITIAEFEKVDFALEPVSNHIIHTPERMYQLVSEINNAYLKVIFDISNLMTLENKDSQNEIIKTMFKLLGPHICAVHIKDFDFIDGKKVILPVGEGLLNLDLLMTEVNKCESQVDVLAENIPKEYLKATYKKLNKYRLVKVSKGSCLYF